MPRAAHVVERLRRARRWHLFLLGGVAVALLPWTAYRSATLSEHVAYHWRVAWIDLDLAEAAALVATFVALLRNSPAVTVLASIAGTLLVCDAWFDVASPRSPAGPRLGARLRAARRAATRRVLLLGRLRGRRGGGRHEELEHLEAVSRRWRRGAADRGFAIRSTSCA
jgi:hypothetical protein